MGWRRGAISWAAAGFAHTHHMTEHESLAETLSVALVVQPARVVDVLGGGWERVNLSGAEAFASGDPLQVVIAIDRDGLLTVAQPETRWEGHQPILHLGRTHLVGQGTETTLETIGQAVDAAAKAERRRFIWCKHCRTSTGPATQNDRQTCMGCASAYEGIVY